MSKPSRIGRGSAGGLMPYEARVPGAACSTHRGLKSRSVLTNAHGPLCMSVNGVLGAHFLSSTLGRVATCLRGCSAGEGLVQLMGASTVLG